MVKKFLDDEVHYFYQDQNDNDPFEDIAVAVLK